MLMKRETPKESISDIHKTQKMTEFLQTAEAMQRHAYKNIFPEGVKHPMIFPRSKSSAQVLFKSETAKESEQNYWTEEVRLWENRKNVTIVLDENGKAKAISNKSKKEIRLPDPLRRFLERGVSLPNIERKGLENMAWMGSDTQEKVWDEGFVGKPPRRPFTKEVMEEEVEEDHDKQ